MRQGFHVDETNTGAVTLNIDSVGERYKAEIFIVKSPGAWILFLGALALLISVFMPYQFPNQNIRVIREDTQLTLLGWSEDLLAYQPVFQKMAYQFADELEFQDDLVELSELEIQNGHI